MHTNYTLFKYKEVKIISQYSLFGRKILFVEVDIKFFKDMRSISLFLIIYKISYFKRQKYNIGRNLKNITYLCRKIFIRNDIRNIETLCRYLPKLGFISYHE